MARRPKGAGDPQGGAVPKPDLVFQAERSSRATGDSGQGFVIRDTSVTGGISAPAETNKAADIVLRRHQLANMSKDELIEMVTILDETVRRLLDSKAELRRNFTFEKTR